MGLCGRALAQPAAQACQETRVCGWAYLYRASGGDGQLVDVMLSEHRDLDAARAFFESARGVVGPRPKQVSTDGHTPYPRAIEETLGKRGAPQHLWSGPPDRARPSGHPTALLSNAGVQGVQDGRWFLPRVGRSAELFSTPAEDGARDLLGEETAAVHWTVPEVARSILWGMTNFCTGLPSLSNSGPPSEKPSSDRFVQAVTPWFLKS